MLEDLIWGFIKYFIAVGIVIGLAIAGIIWALFHFFG